MPPKKVFQFLPLPFIIKIVCTSVTIPSIVKYHLMFLNQNQNQHIFNHFITLENLDCIIVQYYKNLRKFDDSFSTFSSTSYKCPNLFLFPSLPCMDKSTHDKGFTFSPFSPYALNYVLLRTLFPVTRIVVSGSKNIFLCERLELRTITTYKTRVSQ